MSYSIILAIITAVVFLLAYVTRRRFGVLVLALVAGQMLSGLWVNDLTPLIASQGVYLVKPPLRSLVALGLILLPSVFLLISGPSARKPLRRLIGSLTFAVAAVTLAIEYINDALVVDEIGKQVQSFIVANSSIIITVCVVLSLIDIFLMHTRQKLTKEGHGSHKAHHKH